MKSIFYRASLLPLIFLACFILSGKSTPAIADPPAAEQKAVQYADKCLVDYSCRFSDGSLLITTLQSVADDPGTPKSDVFIQLQQYQPIELIAGINSPVSNPQAVFTTLGQLNKRLAERIVGAIPGKTVDLNLEASDIRPTDQSLVELNIHQTRHIELDYPLEVFKRFTKGQEPVVGMEIQLEPPKGRWFTDPGGLMGRVTAVIGDKVLVRQTIKPGETFETLFGPAVVERFREDNLMDIRLQPKVGQVLRLGYSLARISKVDDRIFVVDTSHPFAGEVLQCQAVVRSADANSPEKAAMVEQMQSDMEHALAAGQGAPTEAAGASADSAVAVAAAVAEIPTEVQNGDLVWVNYRIKDEKGRNWQSNFPEDKATSRQKKAEQPLPRYFPVVAGRQTVVPGIETAVLGLKSGDRKQVTLTAEQAFGNREQSQVKEFDRARQIPVKTTLEVATFKREFKIEPRTGASWEMPPFGTATVEKATDKEVTFALKPEKKYLKHSYGTTDARKEGENLIYTLNPKIGAEYEEKGRRGVITAVNDKKFTVDFNHPLAGQAVTIEFAVHDFRKASALNGNAITWNEDFEQARNIASKEGKKMALMLYADWCGWCKRMFAETLTDPIITDLSNNFVWVKVNSDQHKEYMERFGQKGFPMLVLLDKEGNVIEKQSGFQAAYPLWEALQKAMAHKS